MKAIVIEGPDGCGKSLLAKFIGDQFNLPVHSFGGPPGYDEKTIVDLMVDQQNMIGRGNCILDRCTAISEFVYSRVMGRDHGYALQYVMRSFQLHILYEAHVIMCYTANPNPRMSAHDTIQTHTDALTHASELATEYHRRIAKFITRKSPGKIILFNYATDTYDSVLEGLMT